MSDWKDIVRAVSPAVAGLLGGPLAATAVQALSGALLGKPDGTQEEIAAVVASGNPDALAKIKQAETELKEKLVQAGIDLEQIAASDRANARAALIQTKSLTPALLSWLVVAATLALYTHLLFHGAIGVSELIVGRILGTLDTAFGVVLAFWLGTSYSSRQKDETIKSLSQG